MAPDEAALAGTGEIVPYGVRVRELAVQRPDLVALIGVAEDGSTTDRLTWADLERRTAAVAGVFHSRGIVPSSRVVVELPNVVDHLVASIAAWRLGALVIPMSPRLPGRERSGLVEVAEPSIVVGEGTDDRAVDVTVDELRGATDAFDPPDPLPHPGKGIGSGGSTGRSKIIVDPGPWGWDPAEAGGDDQLRFWPNLTQLVCGPLYHNSPFVWSTQGLLLGQTVVLMRRFDASLAVDLIERHGVGWLFLAPTMMRRILALPAIRDRDLSSIRTVFQTAGPCGPELKRAWIELVGGERLIESYGSTENIGHTQIDGDDWLAHPGSVGRGVDTEIRIIGDDGQPVPNGEIGEIFMRRSSAHEPRYRYIGAPPARMIDRFTTIGDLGRLDGDGYLYLADRRVDLIVSGGANVYPAEVEAAILEHDGVADAAVVGLPDEEWGQRVHAIVERRPGPAVLDAAALSDHLRERIASYKRPKTFEFVARLPRDESGKIRRRQLVDERLP